MIDVVVAEDSTAQAVYLKNALTENGFSVRRGRNGQEALDLVREQRPQLIISDIEMPEMTGYQFCAAVKEDEELRDIPVVLLSTLSDPQDIIEGLKAGADNYVTKPYEVPFLLSRIESLLSDSTRLKSGSTSESLEVTLDGKTFRVSSDTQQILNLLISTFEGAVQKNNELIRANQDLMQAQQELTLQNSRLENLNEELGGANARMKRDLDAAARAQQALLPGSLPRMPGVSITWRYKPCDELAGDILNVFQLDEKHLAIYVLDVSGHGVPASLLSVSVSRALQLDYGDSILINRNGSPEITPPAVVAEALNVKFPQDEVTEKYFTLVYGVLNVETREFRYACAGHPAPFKIGTDASPVELAGSGFPVGIVEEPEFEEESLLLAPGDRLYLFSDGIPEAMNSDVDQFGNDRLGSALTESYGMSLDESASHLMQRISEWVGEAHPSDDISLLAIEVS